MNTSSQLNPSLAPQEIILAEPRGFCAGVDRAIEIVERALEKFGSPIYVRHEIVHNTHVVADLKSRGAVFIESLDDVPADSTLVFSAHGHKGHPEVEGTMGQLASGIHLVEDVDDVERLRPLQTEKLAVVTQTTLSVDDAKEISSAIEAKFPNIRSPKQQDICYATQNRQDAVKMLSSKVDVVVVVGSPTSSNSNRLRDVAANLGALSYMVDDASELKEDWFIGKAKVGLTAGASAPDVLVQEVIARLREFGAVSVRKLDGIQETLKFPLPKGLKLD